MRHPTPIAPILLALLVLLSPAAAAVQRVFDPDGVLSFDGRGTDRIESELRRLAREENISVFLIVRAGIIGGTVQEKAIEARSEYLKPGDEGLVIVCDTDSHLIGMALAEAAIDERTGEVLPARVPEYLMLDAVREARAEVNLTGRAEADDLGDLVEVLCGKLRQISKESRQSPRRSGWGLVLLPVAACVLVALVFAFGSRWLHRQRTVASREILFPEVEVGHRLGASFGGGHVREMKFRPPR